MTLLEQIKLDAFQCPSLTIAVILVLAFILVLELFLSNSSVESVPTLIALMAITRASD